MRELYTGLMSGTSMDGIDAALFDLSGDQARLLASHCKKYSPALHTQLDAALRIVEPRSADLDELDRQVGEHFAAAANELLEIAHIPADQVTAIGSHGQTVRHHPDGDPAARYTVQLGDPSTIAERTGITVVADFRRRDIAAGGEGAPLVPAFHAARFCASHSPPKRISWRSL